MNIGSTTLMSLVTTRAASESAREDRMKAAGEAKLRDAKAAVETLSRRRSQASEERKAMARQKIEQLKARLQALKSMASIDPKGTARLAAQLARELGAAVKAYAAAGGVTAGMDAGGAATPASAPAPSPEAGAGEAAQAEPAAETNAAAATGETPTDGDEPAGGKPANPYQQAIDQTQARAAEITRRSGEKQADNDFVAAVRKLAAEIKQLVRQATERAGDKGALSPEEARELEAMVAAMDREIEQASADMGAGVSLLV